MHHQCPMDCEDGKTYSKTGSCPPCKIKLILVSNDTTITNNVHKDGEYAGKATSALVPIGRNGIKRAP